MPRARRQPAKQPAPIPRAISVFINVPFDQRYERLFVALIAGLAGLGLVPRSSLEIPAVGDRLNRIFRLLRACAYSINDLSRVQLSRTAPRSPRFNMPFEAGLAASLMLRGANHKPFFLEAIPYRLGRSLSDLGGIDPPIHRETVRGMLRAILDIFGRGEIHPNLDDLSAIYRTLRRIPADLKRQYETLYVRTAFLDLVHAAQRISAARRARNHA